MSSTPPKWRTKHARGSQAGSIPRQPTKKYTRRVALRSPSNTCTTSARRPLHFMEGDSQLCLHKPQALPDKRFGEKVQKCKGGKKSKRLTVSFIVSGAGRSETKLIVIWKSEDPHCFKESKRVIYQ